MGFTIPNEADAFNANQAEPDKVDIDILVAAIGGVGVVAGCEVTAQASPDMTVAVAAGTIRNAAGTEALVAAGNVTIPTSDATNPRFDLVVVDDAGVKSCAAGTAATNPVFPAIPADSVVLAAVYVPANDTTIGSNQIVDKRAFATPGGAFVSGGFPEHRVVLFGGPGLASAAPSSLSLFDSLDPGIPTGGIAALTGGDALVDGGAAGGAALQGGFVLGATEDAEGAYVGAGGAGTGTIGGDIRMKGGYASGGAAEGALVYIRGAQDDAVPFATGGDVEITTGTPAAGSGGRGGDVDVTLSPGDGAGRDGQLLIHNLPAADPGVSGALWYDPGDGNRVKYTP